MNSGMYTNAALAGRSGKVLFGHSWLHDLFRLSNKVEEVVPKLEKGFDYSLTFESQVIVIFSLSAARQAKSKYDNYLTFETVSSFFGIE